MQYVRRHNLDDEGRCQFGEGFGGLIGAGNDNGLGDGDAEGGEYFFTRRFIE